MNIEVEGLGVFFSFANPEVYHALSTNNWSLNHAWQLMACVKFKINVYFMQCLIYS